MASDLSFVEFVCEQAGNAGEVTFKKMFGEYGIYLNNKFIAVVCDNQLFVKPTKAGAAILKDIVEAPPYPQAKPYFLIQGNIEDQDLISSLFRATAEELPEPRPKKIKIPKSKN